MRISDWISDVCSSDLFLSLPRRLNSWRPVYVERVNIWWTAPSPQRPPSRVRMDLSLSHAAIAFTPIEPDTPSPSRASRKMVRTVSAWKGSISSRFLTLAPRCSAATRSEEHTSELQSLMHISYAVFCLKKKKQTIQQNKKKHTT